MDLSDISFGRRLHGRAVADPDEIGLTVVAIDGIAVALTLSELDRRANQWGRALMDAGTAATKVNRSAMIEVRGG